MINVRAPTSEVAVSRMPDDEHVHENVYVANRDAFDAARRQLQVQLRQSQGKARKSNENMVGKHLNID